jgi:hypothetical protein
VTLRELQWPSKLAVLATIATALLIAFPGDGQRLLISFPLQVFGLLMLAISLYRYRYWWLLLTLPVLAFPLTLWGTLLFQCLNGNCL